LTPDLGAFLAEHTPGPTVAPHPSIVRARAALNAVLDGMCRVSDDALLYAWDWAGREVNLRYGFYRQYELLEAAGSEVARALAGTPSREARDAVAATTSARWQVHGTLAPLDEGLLDQDPGGGEWTLRQTLAHMVNGQRAYTAFNAWWLTKPAGPITADSPMPPQIYIDAAGEEVDDGEGTLGEIRSRLDLVVDQGSARFGQLSDDELALPARWSGYPVTLAFRQWRWSSHIREHTIQVDKTLAMLGHVPTEVERLVRLVASAYGRLEANAFGFAPELLDASGTSSRAASAVLDHVSEALEGAAHSLPSAAEARIPTGWD
jgi:DinB superfamily